MEYHQQQDFHYQIQHQSSIILVRIKKPSLVQSCDFLDLPDLDRSPKGPQGRICCLDSVFTFPDTIVYWQMSSKRTKCQGVDLKVWACGASSYIILLLSGSTKPQHLPALTF